MKLRLFRRVFHIVTVHKRKKTGSLPQSHAKELPTISPLYLNLYFHSRIENHLV